MSRKVHKFEQADFNKNGIVVIYFLICYHFTELFGVKEVCLKGPVQRKIIRYHAFMNHFFIELQKKLSTLNTHTHINSTMITTRIN